MRSSPMIEPAVSREDAPEMRLVDDDHVIQTLSSDRADQAFDVWILPRTRRRGNDLGDAEADQSSAEDVAENAVAVTVQPAGRRVVRKGLDLSVAKTASRRTVANRVVLDPCPPPLEWVSVNLSFANTGSISFVGDAFLRRCPFLALSVQQGAANGSKGRHKANADNRSTLAATMPDPAASSTSRQRAASDVFSAC